MIGGWTVLEEKYDDTPDGGGVTVREKWFKAQCVCGRIEYMPSWKFTRSGSGKDCGCGGGSTASLRRRSNGGKMERRLGRPKLTDGARRVPVSFTIPFETIGRLAERSMREGKSASQVVVELVEEWLEGSGAEGGGDQQEAKSPAMGNKSA